MRAAVILLTLAGCGRVDFGYPVVNCDEVTGSEARLGPDEHCYVRNDVTLSRDDASNACLALGGHTASITSDEENAFIASSLGLSVPTRIGFLTESDTSKNWIWETREAAVYEHWAAGSPTYCASAYRTTALIDASGGWTTACSYEAAPVVCEIEPWLVDESTGHAYRISWTSQSWLSANATCQAMGAHLATLSTVEERLVAARIATMTVWIGGSTTDGTTFTWVDGTTVVGAPWASGEPDSGPTACIALSYTQAFFDNSCTASQPALCERDE